MSREAILFVAQRIPFPPNKGDKIRSFNELKYLSSHYDIDCLTFVDDPFDMHYRTELLSYVRTLKVVRLFKPLAYLKGLVYLLFGRSISQGYFANGSARAWVKQQVTCNRYRYVLCFSFQTAQYVSGLSVRKIMDFCDVDSVKFAQYAQQAGFPRRAIFALESRRVARWEGQINQEFDASMLVTAEEAALFGRSTKRRNVHVLTNGVDTKYFKPLEITKELAVVFTGDMAYHANVDGICWFCSEMLPSIQNRLPKIRLYVVGRNPAPRVKELANCFPGTVIVTGAVEDTRPFIAKAQLAVIPLRIARGIQNKVLEAMAMGIPVVIPTSIAQSLDGLSQSEAFVFSTPQECIDHIINGFNNPEMLKATGENGLDYVGRNYSWESRFSNSLLAHF